jgi:hypothetical protein
MRLPPAKSNCEPIMTTLEQRSGVTEPVQHTRATAIAARGEWRFVAAIIALVLILTSAPYIFANVTAPSDRQFMGIMLDVPDHIQYFSWMRDLARAPLAANRLTAEPNDPALFNLLWWALGHLGAATGLDYAALFTLLRVLAIAVGLGGSYFFLRVAVPDDAQRRLAFILIAFGGGIGLIWIVVKYVGNLPAAPFPFDTYTAEPNTFLSMLGYPHFALAMGLLVATFALLLIALRKQQLRYALFAGIVALILGVQHTYDLVTMYGVFGVFGLLIWLRDRRFPRFLFICGVIIVGISAPPAGYSFLLTKNNPVWAEVLSQFDNAGAFTPNPLHLPILMGLPLLLALIGFRPRMLQSRNEIEIFVGAWFLTHFVLVYLPLEFQIHLLLGWQVPIAVLAAATLLTRIKPALANRSRTPQRLALGGLVGLALITNVYIFAWRFIELKRHELPYYLTRDEVAALDWLEANTDKSDVVLSTLDFNQFTPMWSDARAFLAHWTGTLDYHNKIAMVDTVLGPDARADQRQAILDQFNVTHIVAGTQRNPQPTAQNALPPSQLADLLSLRPVFAQGEVVIYQTSFAEH